MHDHPLDVERATPAQLTALAQARGLTLDPETMRFSEAGLDYRVAFARDAEGTPWVLRLPRRPDVSAKLAEERRILDFIAPRLSVAVPKWEVCDAQLITYRRLPGYPGLTLDDLGQPHWHVEPTSAEFATALGRLIAQLHAIDVDEARAAGVPVESPDAVRARWRDQLDQARAAFTIAPHLSARWEAWLSDDTLWPTTTVFTHGELYAAHVLIESPGEIVGVLDWTTAKVSDPAIDLTYQHMMGPDAFAATVQAYRDAGGAELPNIAARCAAILDASPLTYGMFALQSQEPQHLATAAAMLNPPQED